VLEIRGRIRKGIEIGPLTSIGIGGKTRYLIDVYDLISLKKVLRWLSSKRIPYLVIGQGTNLLFCGDFAGALIRLGGNFKRMWISDRIVVGAGIELKRMIRRLIANGYGGLEELYGIPGTLGGAVAGNAGAFGRSIGDFVERVWITNPDGSEQMLSSDRLGFGYRNTKLPENTIITFVELTLRRGKGSLRKAEGYLKKRSERIPHGLSAGCIFKNPEDDSAGRLIEACGLKGYSRGDAVISPHHANFIINRGNANFSDVIFLIEKIRREVKRRFGYDLELEVRIIR